MEILNNIDVVVFRAINGAYADPAVDQAMMYITDLARPAIFILALMFLVFKGRTRMTGILLMAGLSASYYGVHGIKALVARSRPFVTLENVRVIVTPSGFSFPSGHSTAAFMAAFILTKNFGKWYLFYPLAVIVALSRPYLGVHYPSDILAGALLGTLIGYILSRAGRLSD